MRPPFSTDCDSYVSEIDSPVMEIPGEADIFGPNNILLSTNTEAPQTIHRLSWTGNYGYEVATVATFLLFGYLIYNFWANIGQLGKAWIGRTPFRKLYEEQTFFFKQYLHISSALGLLVSGCIALQIADHFTLQLPFPWLTIYPWLYHLSILAWILSGMILIGYRSLVRGAIQKVTQSNAFFEEYLFKSRAYGALSYIIVTPLFLFFDLQQNPNEQIWITLLLSLSLLLYIFYIGKSLVFFLQRNVSILQWFLYLCVVDLLPFSLILFLFLRQG